MESLLWSLRFGSTFVTVMGFGHCLYISAVEVTARRRLPTPNSMIDHFQATFPLAKKYSQGLGAIPTLMSAAHYFLNPEHPSSKLLLFAGLSIISIGPYTKFFILPTNHLLLDGESKILENLEIHYLKIFRVLPLGTPRVSCDENKVKKRTRVKSYVSWLGRNCVWRQGILV